VSKARMVATLPPVPCEPEMRDRIRAIAARERRSISDVQRQALSLYLSVFDRETIETDNKPSESRAGKEPA
jgi:hypothetical protein